MSSAKEHWDKRYRDAELADSNGACEVLRKHVHLLPARGRALDVASGLGHNALLLAAQGLSVKACDISAIALAKSEQAAKHHGLTITTEQRDLEAEGLGSEQFDVICVSRYLHRPLCPAITRALKPSGLLFYQTFCAEKLAGPSNPDFVLQNNELLSLFAPLQLRYYSELGQLGDVRLGNRNEALYIGQKTQ